MKNKVIRLKVISVEYKEKFLFSKKYQPRIFLHLKPTEKFAKEKFSNFYYAILLPKGDCIKSSQSLLFIEKKLEQFKKAFKVQELETEEMIQALKGKMVLAEITPSLEPDELNDFKIVKFIKNYYNNKGE